jgi:hypothetical protein
MIPTTDSFAARLDGWWSIMFRCVELCESLGFRATGDGPSVIRYIDVILEAA